jgi:hypothetical protein
MIVMLRWLASELQRPCTHPAVTVRREVRCDEIGPDLCLLPLTLWVLLLGSQTLLWLCDTSTAVFQVHAGILNRRVGVPSSQAHLAGQLW